jgi:hypothetical protein
MNIAQLLDAAEFATRSGAKPVVLFVQQPGRFELSDPHTVAAKTSLFEKLDLHGVPYADTRDAVERTGGTSLFRDGLHPNTGGNRVLAQVAVGLLVPVVGATSAASK